MSDNETDSESKPHDEDAKSNGGGLETIAILPTPKALSLYARIVTLFVLIAGFLRTKLFASKIHTTLIQLEPATVVNFCSLGKKNRPFGSAVINDRHLVFQTGIKLMSKRGLHGLAKNVTEKLNNAAVSLLHKPQPQPLTFLGIPTSSLSQRYPYVRMIDSHNPLQVFPDPKDVFDALLADKKPTSSRVDHPSGISSLFFAFATLISLSLFRTNLKNSAFNETSPALDLSPLYGSNKDEEDQVRIKDGRGMLSPDCFFEDRLLFLPPAVAALLILWNRNHNYIARRLLLNNEDNGWVDPSTRSSTDDSKLDAHLATQDDKIFETARLINCGHFRNIIMEDFFKGLVGLANVGSSANLDILGGPDTGHTKKGQGYHAGVEFSLLYHWSALISKVDVEWTERVMKQAFGDTALDKITADEFKVRVESIKSDSDPSCRRRQCAGFQRGQDGRFKDDDLARILQDATESVAGTPGARGIPACFRVMESLVISQAREWNVCSLNDFRKHLGLKAFKNFQEWNPNAEIISAANDLYKNIENLELYPGLQVEAITPGSGFSLGYTMTYGLLVNLTTLIRSDPRLTIEFTEIKLTKWGFNDCAPNPDNGAFGAMLPRLILRNLPRNYAFDNIYGLFPLTSPALTKKILSSSTLELSDVDCGLADAGFKLSDNGFKLDNMYDLERPMLRETKTLETRTAISYVLNDPRAFPTAYGRDLKLLTNGYGFMLGFDDEKLHDLDQIMSMYSLIPDSGALSRYATFYRATADRLIKEKSKSEATSHIKSIDVVRDVINVTCTRWVCDTICGLPVEWTVKDKRLKVVGKVAAHMSKSECNQGLKWEEGKDLESEVFRKFAALYSYVFRNIDPDNGWVVRSTALDASRALSKHIECELQTTSSLSRESLSDRFARIVGELKGGIPLVKQSAHNFLARLLNSSKTIGRIDDPTDFSELPKEEFERLRVVANALGLSVVASVSYAQACSRAVDFYLDEKRSKERDEIIRLSKSNGPAVNKEIMGYIREAQRLDQSTGLFRDVKEDTNIPQGNGRPDITVKKGDRIYADLRKAHLNVVDFKSAEKIDCRRETPSIQGMGLHKCPGIVFVDNTMPELFKTIFRLKNLRRKAGREGQLGTFNTHTHPLDTDPMAYLNAAGEISLVPETLILQYDEEGVPETPKKKGWNISSRAVPTIRWGQRVDRTLIVFAAGFVMWLVFFILASFWRHQPSLSTVIVVFLVASGWWLRPSVALSVPLPSRLSSRSAKLAASAGAFVLLFSFYASISFKARRPSTSIRDLRVQSQNITCQAPTTIFQPWGINTILSDSHGNPMPIEYTLNHGTPHRLSVVDVDALDMQLGVWVDEVLRGLTTDFQLNKSVNCGEDPKVCVIDKGFSAGVVIVAPGKHTVRIAWVGKEFLPNTTDIDWGTERSRRFAWQREYCA